MAERQHACEAEQKIKRYRRKGEQDWRKALPLMRIHHEVINSGEPAFIATDRKTSRSGVGGYTLRVHGRAAHAGLEVLGKRDVAALCGYTPGDPDSLRHATEVAMTAQVDPDPAPFDPDTYFNWMLGEGQ